MSVPKEKTMKNYLMSTLIALQAIFEPAKPMFLTIFVLMLSDLILGLLAAKKRGEALNSNGITRTVVKFIIYGVAVGLAFLTQTYLTGDAIPSAKIIASIIGTSELMSCMENLNSLSGGELLKQIIEKLNTLGKQ